MIGVTLDVRGQRGTTALALPADPTSVTAIRTGRSGVAHLPAELAACVGLEVLACEASALASIDETAAAAWPLRWVDLSETAITGLPAGASRWALDTLRLETLSLFEDALEHLPDVLLRLPAMRSLVVSGNPGSRRIKAALRKAGVRFTVS